MIQLNSFKRSAGGNLSFFFIYGRRTRREESLFDVESKFCGIVYIMVLGFAGKNFMFINVIRSRVIDDAAARVL